MVLWSDRERSQMGHSSHPRSSQIGYLLPELLMSPKWIGVSRGHMHGFILQICYKLCITESDTQTCCKVINCELHFLQIFLLLVPPRASKFTSDLEFELLDLDNLCSHVSVAHLKKFGTTITWPFCCSSGTPITILQVRGLPFMTSALRGGGTFKSRHSKQP